MTAFTPFRIGLLTTVCVASLSGCSPVMHTRGNFLQDHQIMQVTEGVDTRSEVIKKLGSPTTISPFDDTVWFYLGQKTKKVGIFDPEVVDERIVLVKYDEEFDTVQTIMEVEHDRLDIPLSDEITKTGGQDPSILQELLGNLGRFNREGSGASATDL